MKKIIVVLFMLFCKANFGQLKISQLPAASALTGAELLPAAQGTVTVKIPTAAFQSTISGGYEPKLNGTGFVKSTGTVTSYDNTSYAPTSTLSNYLTVANPAYTGTLTTGGLTYTDTGILASLQSSVNGYNQVIVQNTSNSANASANFIVSNNIGTKTTNYGEFGMNSSTFTGTPIFSKANAVYLTSATTDLAVGTVSNNSIYLATNGLNRVKVDSTGNVLVTSTLAIGQSTTPTRDLDVHNLTRSSTGEIASDLTSGLAAWYLQGSNPIYYMGMYHFGSAITFSNGGVFRNNTTAIDMTSPYSVIYNPVNTGTLAFAVGSTSNSAELVRLSKDLIAIGTTSSTTNVRGVTNFSSTVNTNSSVSVGGNLTVAGSETVTGAMTASNSVTTPSLIGTNTLTILPVITATTGLIQLGTTGHSVNIGNASVNTTSLGIVRIGQRTSFIDFGEQQSGVPAIWLGKTPSTTNPSMYADANSTYVNGVTNVVVATGGAIRHWFTQNGLRVGSGASAPTATLDVSGTMSVQSTATLAAALTCQSTLSVQTTSTLTGNVRALGTLSVSSTTSMTGLNNTGAMTTSTTFSCGTNATITGTSLHTGASTFVAALTGSNVIASSSKTAGIGYAVGSGSTVTQATSRTTGVTINAITGSITLVSAAGTTTWQSFTVTNSAVAVNDVIIINQRSGADLNEVFITNVSAGSFQVSFATTGGTTVEQPVFNFAVIKGQTN